MSEEEITFTIDSESSLLGAYTMVGQNNLAAYTAASGYSAGANDTDDADDIVVVGNGNSRTIDIAANDSAKDIAKRLIQWQAQPRFSLRPKRLPIYMLRLGHKRQLPDLNKRYPDCVIRDFKQRR